MTASKKTVEDVSESNGHGQNRIAPKGTRSPVAVKLVIPELTAAILEVKIRGITPLVIRAWDDKTAQHLADRAMGKKAAKSRENVDPQKTFDAARYVSRDGWDGIPAGAFKAAIVDAVSCADIPRNDFSMTAGKRSFFILADGECAKSGRELVRIHGKAEMFSVMQPTAAGTPYMSYRPKYNDWSCKLRIQYNATRIDAQGVINLLSLAGFWCGVGEHRPSAKESKTGNFGRWEIIPGKI